MYIQILQVAKWLETDRHWGCYNCFKRGGVHCRKQLSQVRSGIKENGGLRKALIEITLQCSLANQVTIKDKARVCFEAFTHILAVNSRGVR